MFLELTRPSDFDIPDTGIQPFANEDWNKLVKDYRRVSSNFGNEWKHFHAHVYWEKLEHLRFGTTNRELIPVEFIKALNAFSRLTAEGYFEHDDILGYKPTERFMSLLQPYIKLEAATRIISKFIMWFVKPSDISLPDLFSCKVSNFSLEILAILSNMLVLLKENSPKEWGAISREEYNDKFGVYYDLSVIEPLIVLGILKKRVILNEILIEFTPLTIATLWIYINQNNSISQLFNFASKTRCD